MTRSWKRGLGTEGSSSSGMGVRVVVVDCAEPAGNLAEPDSGVSGMHVSCVGVYLQMGVAGGKVKGVDGQGKK